jgi:hypothetical protein
MKLPSITAASISHLASRPRFVARLVLSDMLNYNIA